MLMTKGKSVNITVYRGMVGSLLYLTASRPDIMFATCLCARFQANPKESHLIAIKRIFRYLKGTQNLGLWYPKDTCFNLVGYSDADYAGCRVDRRVLLEAVNFLVKDWCHGIARNNNQFQLPQLRLNIFAAGSCCAQVLWIRNQLRETMALFWKRFLSCVTTLLQSQL